MEHEKSELIYEYQVPSKILELIDHAERDIIILSPYIKLWDQLSEALTQAKRRNISISVITSEDCKNLTEIENITDEIYILKNFHAKLYLNEKMAILTSMNLYKKSAQKNFELGYLTTKHDKLINLKNRIWVLKNRIWNEPFKPYDLSKKGGYCMRYKARIPTNIKKPLCSDCYNSWANYKYAYYHEEFCHICGTPSDVSYVTPCVRAALKVLINRVVRNQKK